VSGDDDRRGPLWRTIVVRGGLLALGAVAINALAPLLVEVFSTAPRLTRIHPAWYVAMLAFEVGSFAAAWALARLAVRNLSWFDAAASQLTANSASRVFPGGAVVGSAVYYRMLSAAGTEPAQAAAALTVNSLVSTMVLVALPAIAGTMAIITAPIPPGLLPIAFGGVGIFAALFIAGFLAVRFDAPLRVVAGTTISVLRRLAGLVNRSVSISAERVIAIRDDIVDIVGPRWLRSVGLAASNWLLDYLTLVAALYAVGARPRLSIVLLAYAASAVLSMIPITPGGLGFVEAGLTATLTIAGVPAADALLATLAYRLFSFWLPIPAGGVAYAMFRRRRGKLPESADADQGT
jgi:uncharacterized membrane protein YbhN (UPF0104 family)